MARRAARVQRLLRRRRVRRHLGAPLADRAARREGLALGQDRALRDGARDAHARDLAARHHDLLAADPERLGAGDPPPARRAARADRAVGERRRHDRVHRRARRGVVPARRLRRDGAEEPRVLGARPRGAACSRPRWCGCRSSSTPSSWRSTGSRTTSCGCSASSRRTRRRRPSRSKRSRRSSTSRASRACSTTPPGTVAAAVEFTDKKAKDVAVPLADLVDAAARRPRPTRSSAPSPSTASRAT